MEAKYCKILDCPSNGENHEWDFFEAKAEYVGWGYGNMKQAKCNKCQTVKYLQFEDIVIQTTVNEKNFGELLLKSCEEAFEHAQGKRQLKTTYGESKDELQKKR